MNRPGILDSIDHELSSLNASLERNGFRTRREDQPHIVRRGEIARHYSFGSPHPKGYTRHHEWEELRQRLFRARSKQCQHCGRTRIVQVHHRYYFSGCQAWEYEGGDLFLLCKVCHSLVHGYVQHARDLLLEEHSPRPATYRSSEELDDEDFGEGEEFLGCRIGRFIDPLALFDEDNPELWQVEYIDDPEGRSDWLRPTLADEPEDEWHEDTAEQV